MFDHADAARDLIAPSPSYAAVAAVVYEMRKEIRNSRPQRPTFQSRSSMPEPAGSAESQSLQYTLAIGQAASLIERTAHAVWHAMNDFIAAKAEILNEAVHDAFVSFRRKGEGKAAFVADRSTWDISDMTWFLNCLVFPLTNTSLFEGEARYTPLPIIRQLRADRNFAAHGKHGARPRASGARRHSDLAVGVILHNAGFDEVARLQAEVELAILRNQLLGAQAEKAEMLARAERAAAVITNAEAEKLEAEARKIEAEAREIKLLSTLLRETTLRPAAELLAGKDGWDVALDERLKIEVAQAYATKMPEDFRQLMPNRVLQMAIEQSCEIETWHGVVPSAILAKDITVDAFKNAIPFYSDESPGRGPRLIAEAERVVLGNILATSRGFRTFRGPFRDLWEVLVHVSWKLARIWLADWLQIVRPMAVFAMGGQVVRSLLDGIVSDSPRTTRMPIFRLAGRPMVVAFGDGSNDVCLLIPCIDPGKAKYSALASPFEQALIVLAKAVHLLAVALVLELWRGQVALGPFLTATLLPRLLSDIEESGLGACRDRVVGPQGSRERADWVAGLEADIQKERTAGRAILLSELLPRLAFGKIGDEAWVTCASSVAEGTDLWESMKSWGTSPTDSMRWRSGGPNDARVAAIGAPGYSLLPYDKQSYEYTCETCSEPFLCDDRGRCGDRHEHKHNGEAASYKRERIAALSSVASTLCALEAKGKNSPLPSLVREIPATVAMGVGAVAEVSVLVAKNAAFLAEERISSPSWSTSARVSIQLTPKNRSPRLLLVTLR
ncbi:hypothetical protein HDU89_008561 [Geranomyces variabilis]|nr:hypothetical protein HDU89_008561 [Geranomyces variabilis]